MRYERIAKKEFKAGFTLIELLIVIAIISIFAAILFPVFARARENARRSSCQSNLKQLGLGIFQYTQDYDEKMPGQSGAEGVAAATDDAWLAGSANWVQGIFPYLKSKQIYLCPSQPPAAAGESYGTGDISYTFSGPVNYLSLAGINSTATTNLLWEFEATGRSRKYPNACNFTTNVCDVGAIPFVSPFARPVDVHFDGSNVLFCDGHVKWLKRLDANKYWNPSA